MILYAAALKLFLFGALVVRMVLPFTTGNDYLDWGVFVVGMLGVAVAVGVVESIMARLRLVHVPLLLVGACLLSGFGILLLVRG
jgi:formate hydrogenlyase subunit 4